MHISSVKTQPEVTIDKEFVSVTDLTDQLLSTVTKINNQSLAPITPDSNKNNQETSYMIDYINSFFFLHVHHTTSSSITYRAYYFFKCCGFINALVGPKIY